MNDFLKALEAKSDQWNAVDLVGEDRTFTIVGVKVNLAAEQKVSVQFKESPDKVWRPCKGMGRVMAELWRTGDPQDFVGKQVTLFCDPEVTYGAGAVGGIRIRAMSHLGGPRSVNVKISRTKYKQYPIAPLAAPQAQRPAAPPAPTAPDLNPSDALYIAKREAAKGTDHFRAWFNSEEGKGCRASGALTPEAMTELRTIASGADAMRAMPDPLADAELPPVPTDPEILAQINRDLDAQLAAEGGHPSLAAAQSAAQADYDARIIAALEVNE